MYRHLCVILVALAIALPASAASITVTPVGLGSCGNPPCLGQPITVKYTPSTSGPAYLVYNPEVGDYSGCSEPVSSPPLPQCTIANDSQQCILGSSAGGAITNTLSIAVPATYEFCGWDDGGTFGDGTEAITVSNPSSTSGGPSVIGLSPPPNYLYTYNTVILPGASANVVFNLPVSGVSMPSSFASWAADPCPYGVCMVLTLPPAGGKVSGGCPTTIYGAQQCIANSPVTTSCLLVPNNTATQETTTPQTMFYDYFTPNSLLANGIVYRACAYLDDSFSNPSNPSSTPEGPDNAVYASSFVSFLVNGTMPAAEFGFESSTNPAQFLLGNSTQAVFGPSDSYFTLNSNLQICGPGSACYIELARQSSGGCEAPLTPQDSPTQLPACGFGVPQIPCILDTLSNGGNGNDNSGSEAYTQVLNTGYLPNGNYMLCGYDYTDIQNNQAGYGLNPPDMVSLFTSVSVVDCNLGYCGALPTQTPSVVEVSTTIPPGFNSGVIGNVAALQTTVCGLYGTLNEVFLILALALMIIGGIMYAASPVMPGQARGTVEGYAWVLIVVGVVGGVIAVLSLWIISVSVNTTVQEVLSGCAGIPPL